ncbi:hypothetical protein [Burkholderia cepacia]|uniref:hypothetical protein n=1 Tax=Burkholderia cepacia TaxID=292 RepID=UPI0012D8F100|nr:hypothetical protein [Burkholderia cepacia]
MIAVAIVKSASTGSCIRMKRLQGSCGRQTALLQLAGASPLIKGKLGLGGSHGAVNYICSENADTEDHLVVLFHCDYGLHRLRDIEEYLL